MKGATPIYIKKESDTGILMLHGFSSTPEDFREMAGYLAAKGFTVSAPLIAGHGTMPEDLEKTCPSDWMESAKGAYLQLKSECKRVFLVGNSFGSNLAFWLTKEFKNEPSGIVSLSAPIFLRYQWIIFLRIYTYGFFKKLYYKPATKERKQTDYFGEFSYCAIPTKSIRDFLAFIRRETKPNLNRINVPALVAQSDNDPTVHPKSAEYIYNHLASPFKELYRVFSKHHTFTEDEDKTELFEKVFDFINQTSTPNVQSNPRSFL